MILFQWSPCVEEAMSLVDQLTHDFLTTQTELLSANPRAQPVALDVDTKAVIWITGSEMRSNIYIYIRKGLQQWGNKRTYNNPLRLETIAIRLEAIGLEAIASRWEAIAIRNKQRHTKTTSVYRHTQDRGPRGTMWAVIHPWQHEQPEKEARTGQMSLQMYVC